MRYLVTYAECFAEGHADEDYTAGALCLLDSESEAVALVVFELWDSGGVTHDKPGDWLRYDVYRYAGDETDADSVYESLDALDRGDDGDVLHVDVSAEGLRLSWHGDVPTVFGGAHV